MQAKPEEHVTRDIRVDAVDPNSLLVSFLSEVLTHTDMEGAVFIRAAFDALGDNFLEGKITGIPVDNMEREIRAVSYDTVEITKNHETGLYESEITFEV